MFLLKIRHCYYKNKLEFQMILFNSLLCETEVFLLNTAIFHLFLSKFCFAITDVILSDVKILF